MAIKSLGDLEKHAFYILFIAFVLILFWFSLWGLLDEIVDEIKRRSGCKKHGVYLGMLLVVLGIIAFFPRALERF
jgi:hypothetical protein